VADRYTETPWNPGGSWPWKRGCRYAEAKTGSRTWATGLTSLGFASSGAASEVRPSGASTPSSLIGPSGHWRTRSGPWPADYRSRHPGTCWSGSTRWCAAGPLLPARGSQTHHECPGKLRGGHRVIRWFRKLEGRPPTPHRHTRPEGPDPRRTGSSYSTSLRSRSPDTGTEAPRSPTPGSPTTPNGRCRGEPVAWKHTRRVRRAAWGNGPMATSTPRPRPTQPSWKILLCVVLAWAASEPSVSSCSVRPVDSWRLPTVLDEYTTTGGSCGYPAKQLQLPRRCCL